ERMRWLFWLCLGFCSISLFFTLLSMQFFTFNFAYDILTATKDETALFSTCVLAEFGDGWTHEVIDKAWVDFDPARKCDKDFMPFTILGTDGRLKMNKLRKGFEDVNCVARSLYHIDDFHMNASS
ncbi:hypothetical protein PMAYCL1PPCAC_19539, partial [Pristionchus mayeri]